MQNTNIELSDGSPVVDIINELAQEIPEFANQAKKAAGAVFKIMNGLQHKNLAEVIQGNEEVVDVVKQVQNRAEHIEEEFEPILDNFKHIEDKLGFHLEL